jgi:hypothetical protein
MQGILPLVRPRAGRPLSKKSKKSYLFYCSYL